MKLFQKKQYVVRSVHKYINSEVNHALLEGLSDPDMRFFLAEFGPETAASYSFDVRADSGHLYVSVCSYCRGNVLDAVELLMDPECDGISLLQWGYTAEGRVYETHHLPYRTAETEKWHTLRAEIRRETMSRAREDLFDKVVFTLPLAPFAGLKKIGFNLGCVQNGEAGSWNFSGGGGFPDPDSFGVLYFQTPESAIASAESAGTLDRIDAAALHGATLPRSLTVFDPEGTCAGRLLPRGNSFFPETQMVLTEHGLYRIETDAGQTLYLPNEKKEFRTELHGTHDFPDSWFNSAYTKELLAEEFRRYRARGLTRISWLDYDFTSFCTGRFADRPESAVNLKEFGPDMLSFACRAAHDAGLEFFVLYKPFDGHFNEAEAAVRRQFAIRTDSAYLPKPQGGIRKITLFSDREDPVGGEFTLSASADGIHFLPVDAEIRETTVSRRDALWFGGRTQELSTCRNVRCVSFTLHTPSAADRYFRVESHSPVHLHNRKFRLCEFTGETGNSFVPFPAIVSGNNLVFSADSENAPSWNRTDAGMDVLSDWDGVPFLAGFSCRWPAALEREWEITCPEVREALLNHVRRAVDAHADGFELRPEHHIGCTDWAAYALHPAVLEEFRRRTGRDVTPCREDFLRIQKIRGDAYTDFVRSASELLRKAGLKFHHHVGNRILTREGMDSYCRIEFDWRTWIREGLLDGVSLKYVTMANAVAAEELFPLCRKHNVEINEIAALVLQYENARLQAVSAAKRARIAGFNAINLYELWLYSRAVDGVLVPRRQADLVIEAVREGLS